MKQKQDIETNLLIETIYQTYGYDFRHYKHASIKNRFEKYKVDKGFSHISEMIPQVIHDRTFFEALFLEMSVTVTEMFRDPHIYKALREKVIPQLKTYPFVNIWHAGCATGEEVYSMAILLKEEALLHRSHLYATDINQQSLATAQKGIYPLDEMKRHIENYNASGPKANLGEYYRTLYKGAKIAEDLKKNITFSKHNLATDWVFAETHMIMCRNVLIYFNKELKNKVLTLMTESLCHHGYLCLGSHESIDFSELKPYYEVVDAQAKIYRKI